jgi:hypothetical protein
MFRFFRSKEAGLNAVGTGSKLKQCRLSKQSEAGRRFRNKKKEYLKAKIEELETNSKIRNIKKDLYMGHQ